MTSAPEFQNKAFIMSVPRVNNARALHPTAVEDLLDGKDWPGFGVTEGGAAEGVALGDGPPALVCQLYGARSAGHSVMGQDVLMGQGYVEFFGATVQRLARGEAVSMTVSLEHPRGARALAALAAGHHAGHGRRRRGAVATRDGPGAGADPARLRAGARRDRAGLGRRRAARRVRRREDHARGGGTPAVARGDARGAKDARDPVWDEVVSVEVAEHELDREKVLLAVVNHDTNKLMAKAAVPPKRWRWAATTASRWTSGGASLNVTVVIPQAPARELEFLKKHADYVRVEGSITPPGEAGAGFAGPVAAVWSVSSDSQARARRRPARRWSSSTKPTGLRERRGERPGENGVGSSPGRRAGAAGLEPGGAAAVANGAQSRVVCLAVGDRDGRRARAGARELGGHDLSRGRARGGPRRGRAAHGAEPRAADLRGGTAGHKRRGPRRGGWQGFADGSAWPRESLLRAREKEVAAGFDGGGGLGVGGEGAWMLSAMATDMIDKQQALDEAIVRWTASVNARRAFCTASTKPPPPGRGWRATTRS